MIYSVFPQPHVLHNDLFNEPFISLTSFPTLFLPHLESVLFGGKKVVKGGVVWTWGPPFILLFFLSKSLQLFKTQVIHLYGVCNMDLWEWLQSLNGEMYGERNWLEVGR